MRELLAQTVRMTDPRCRDYGIVRDLHPQHDDLVRVEWLTGAWAGHVTDWSVGELEPLGFGVRPPVERVCDLCLAPAFDQLSGGMVLCEEHIGAELARRASFEV